MEKYNHAVQILNDRIFLLETKNTTYSFCVDSKGLLRHLYYGKRINRAEDFLELPEEGDSGYHPYADRTMEEFSSFGMMRYKETAMKVSFFDGTKDFRYQVSGYEVNGCEANSCRTGENQLTVCLKDEHYPLEIRLHYQVFEKDDIIKRWVTAVNQGKEEIVLERFYSAELGIPIEHMEIVNFTGAWGAEFQRRSDSLEGGKKVYESLRGTTGHVANPSFILHKNADENQGEVYFGALEYTGNFKVVAEALPYGCTNVLLGISDTDSGWKLQAGERFESPAVYLGFTDAGFSRMSLMMHRFCRRELMPKQFADKPLKVLYNSWYATLFDVKCGEQKKLAEKAADMGAELFVVDDGWFGTRDDDFQSLGDWYVDKRKFPNGLNELTSHVNKLGMDFGIWIEPEMVNERSELYRKHPDWVYRFPNREVLKGRNQYTLNLTKEEVVQFMIGFIDSLLTEHNISFVKWDMNRAIGETGDCRGDFACCEGDAIEQKEIWVRHIRNFYRVIQTVRERHPEVEFEACASGGGRVDLGAMRYFDEYWPSDNTDALDRLEIQDGYGLLYPAKYMRVWVTDVPDGFSGSSTPLSFRLHCAMCGALGIGSNLNKMDEKDLQLIKEQIAIYKRIRNTVQLGDLYRLKRVHEDEFAAVQYADSGQSVVFVFQPRCRLGKKNFRLPLKGLSEEALYRVSVGEKECVKSGAFLMHYGLDLELFGDYDSRMIEINEYKREES